MPHRRQAPHRPTVAVLGASGGLGNCALLALTSDTFRQNFTLPIRALSRDASEFESTSDVEFYEVSYNEPETLEMALMDVDTVIDMTSGQCDARPTLEAARRVGVSVYILSEYRVDYPAGVFDGMFAQKRANAEYAIQLGFPRVVQVVSGLLTEWIVKNLHVIGLTGSDYYPIEDGNYKVSSTTMKDVSYTVASLANRQPKRLPGVIRVSSETLTCNQMVDIVKKVTNADIKRREPVSKQTVVQEAQDQSSAQDGFVEFTRAWMVHPAKPLDMSKRTQNMLANTMLWKWDMFETICQRHLEMSATPPPPMW